MQLCYRLMSNSTTAGSCYHLLLQFWLNFRYRRLDMWLVHGLSNDTLLSDLQSAMSLSTLPLIKGLLSLCPSTSAGLRGGCCVWKPIFSPWQGIRSMLLRKILSGTVRRASLKSPLYLLLYFIKLNVNVWRVLSQLHAVESFKCKSLETKVRTDNSRKLSNMSA